MRVRVFVVLYRQADKNYASNLNDKLYAVPKIEDMEYPAYLLGYAYGGSPPCLLVCLSVYVGVGVGVDVLPRARQWHSPTSASVSDGAPRANLIWSRVTHYAGLKTPQGGMESSTLG
jgi:hypothetical protein